MYRRSCSLWSPVVTGARRSPLDWLALSARHDLAPTCSRSTVQHRHRRYRPFFLFLSNLIYSFLLRPISVLSPCEGGGSATQGVFSFVLLSLWATSLSRFFVFVYDLDFPSLQVCLVLHDHATLCQIPNQIT